MPLPQTSGNKESYTEFTALSMLIVFSFQLCLLYQGPFSGMGVLGFPEIEIPVP